MAVGIIREGMLSEKIMSAVILSGEIKRHKLHTFFPHASTNGYHKAYKKLLNAGYIQEITQRWKGYGRSNKKNIYVSATTAGRKAYSELYGEDYLKQITPNIAGKENYDRQAKINDVNALLASCDMAYMPGEKPTLAEYLSLECGLNYISASMQHGIAFSSKEIKEYLKEQHFTGSNIAFDSASGSRFISLLFYKQRVFVIYNTGAKAMLWSSTTEKRLKSILCRMLNNSELCKQRYFPLQSEASLFCIMLCSNKNGLWNLLFQKGYQPIGKEKSGEQNQRASVSLKTISTDYNKAALVTSGSNIKGQFMNVLEYSIPGELENYADKLLTLYPYKTYLRNYAGVVLNDTSNDIVLAFPYLDVHFLLQCHDGINKATFFVPKDTQNVLSVYFKGKAIEFYDADTAETLTISDNFIKLKDDEDGD